VPRMTMLKWCGSRNLMFADGCAPDRDFFDHHRPPAAAPTRLPCRATLWVQARRTGSIFWAEGCATCTGERLCLMSVCSFCCHRLHLVVHKDIYFTPSPRSLRIFTHDCSLVGLRLILTSVVIDTAARACICRAIACAVTFPSMASSTSWPTF